MKRRKYVKQLMALGVPRNRANLMAYCCQRTGQSYADDYRRRSPWLRICQAAHKPVVAMRVNAGYWRSSLARAAAQAKKLAEALRDSVTAQPFRCRDESPSGDCTVEIVGRHFSDGHKIVFSAVDEVHTWNPAEAVTPWPKENPYLSPAASPAAYMCGVDLAAGPDMTTYKPSMRLDTVVINAEPVLPLNKKTASQLADEIEEALRK